jgi:fucose permease
MSKHWRIKLTLFINYFVFAILLNSVGIVILQVQNNFGISEGAASTLEAFKDLPIAITSFLIASFITRIGYKKAMIFALGFIALVCLLMPFLPTFWMTKLLFAATGMCFALIKVSVFATIGLITDNEKEHVSFMNFLESFFMIGVLSAYFIFSAFVDDSNPLSTSWFAVYYLLAGLSLVALFLLLSTPLDESRAHHDDSKSLGQDFGDMLKLIINSLVLIFIVSVFLYVLIEQGLMSWLPSFNKRVFNLPTSLSIQMSSKVVGTLLVLAGILMVVSLSLIDRNHVYEVTGWINAPVAAYVVPLIGICLAPIYPAINSVILSKLPVRQHAPMSGLIVVFSALGGTTGSIITGNLFGIFEGREEIAFYLMLIPIAIILIVLYFFKQKTDAIPFEGGAHETGE